MPIAADLCPKHDKSWVALVQCFPRLPLHVRLHLKLFAIQQGTSEESHEGMRYSLYCPLFTFLSCGFVLGLLGMVTWIPSPTPQPAHEINSTSCSRIQTPVASINTWPDQSANPLIQASWLSWFFFFSLCASGSLPNLPQLSATKRYRNQHIASLSEQRNHILQPAHATQQLLHPCCMLLTAQLLHWILVSLTTAFLLTISKLLLSVCVRSVS